MLRTILRDPLCHFLILAVGLFVVHGIVAHEDERADAREIVVDRDALLNFIQYRTKSFDREVAEGQLAAFTADELDQITSEFVREEAMAREARRLGLDVNDYVIKRRLVQKLDYVARGFVDSVIEVSEQDIKDYFEENKSDFAIQPRITFTHVFYSAERNGDDQAKQLAEAALEDIRKVNAGFEDAARYGERFLYGLNFIDRTKTLIRSQFGQAMTDFLFSLSPSARTWNGPIKSEHGHHVVLVTNVEPGRDPNLEEVRAQVEQQARRALGESRAREAAQEVVNAYEVHIQYTGEESRN